MVSTSQQLGRAAVTQVVHRLGGNHRQVFHDGVLHPLGKRRRQQRWDDQQRRHEHRDRRGGVPQDGADPQTQQPHRDRVGGGEDRALYARVTQPHEIDFEGWHSNLAGLCDFMQLLIDELGLRSCVILSGDVHYSLNVQATFEHRGQVLEIVQLISSALKHSGTLARTALHLLGAAVRTDHTRVGWETPPTTPVATVPATS